MRLYAGMTKQFIEDTIQNQIAEKLRLAWLNYRHGEPSRSEIMSWRNSLRALSQVFQYANLVDQGIILEYWLPLASQRLDCMVSGRDRTLSDNAVIIELKQWEKCQDANGENEVVTWIGGAMREELHPSVQVGRYKMYLEDQHTAFADDANSVKLHACAYMHNYNYYSQSVIFSDKFKHAVSENPVFTADDVGKMRSYLTERLEKGEGAQVLAKIEHSKYRASKKLMDHVGNVIKGKSDYILLDQQLMAYDKVLCLARERFHDKQKAVVIVKGGPGTGKSVIALNLMADLLLGEPRYNAHYVTGSGAFTATLKKIVGSRAEVQFKHTNDYKNAEFNQIDVLICDEAHRIRKTSNTWRTPKAERSSAIQIEELINASKVSVYFVDDYQRVRPNEIGSSDYIRQYALKNNCKLFEYELPHVFRCGGSEAFVNWIDNILQVRTTDYVFWSPEQEFDFRIFGSPQELESSIREKENEGFKARVTAGFCWPWSDPKPDGTLRDDVVIGDYKRPWNAKQEARKLAKGIPRQYLWAHDPNGINQIGCVYSAQGFDFDYVGVIMGMDLVYDPNLLTWKAYRENSYDTRVKQPKEGFMSLVKDAYRILFTRAMKGCYAYFLDKATEAFFKSRIEEPAAHPN